jgi:hypothetical protein
MIEEERAARYSDLFAARHDHGESNCAYCPICTTIGVLRNTKPEVLDHLAAAARELIAVAGILLEEAGDVIAAAEAVGGHKTGATSKTTEDDGKVRRIDIS